MSFFLRGFPLALIMFTTYIAFTVFKHKSNCVFTAIPDLIRLVHGNVCSIQRLIREFREYWRRKSEGLSLTSDVPVTETPPPEEGNDGGHHYTMSKRQLDVKIRELAVYEKRDTFHRPCWYINDKALETYGISGSLSVPTEWQWLTRDGRYKKNTAKESGGETPVRSQSTVPKTPTSGSRSIKQFAVAGVTPVMATPPPAQTKAVSMPVDGDTPSGKPRSVTPTVLALLQQATPKSAREGSEANRVAASGDNTPQRNKPKQEKLPRTLNNFLVKAGPTQPPPAGNDDDCVIISETKGTSPATASNHSVKPSQSTEKTSSSFRSLMVHLGPKVVSPPSVKPTVPPSVQAAAKESNPAVVEVMEID